MKLKEKLNQAAGFTLVELIVVIAILAILAGIAVPVYSGYITNANKQSDITLAGEIEQALWLAYYDQTLGSDAAIIVVYADKDAKAVMSDGTTVSAAGEAAMVAAFGENWKTALRLKYDGWTTTAAEVDMSLIDSSSFSSDKHLDGLTERVSSLSGVLADYFGEGVTYGPLKNYMTENNLSSNDSQVLANLAVLQAADSITKVDEEDFIEAYTLYDGTDLATQMNSIGLDKMSGYAVAYAKMEGLMNYIEAKVVAGNDQDEISSFNTIKAQWVEDSAKLNGVASVQALLDTNTNTLLNDYYSYFDEYATGSQIESDAKAFLSYMGGMNEVAPTLTENLSDLASADYYKGDVVASLLNTYIAAGNVLSAGDGSAIVVVYNGKDNVSILPMTSK